MTTTKHLTVIGATGFLSVPIMRRLAATGVELKAVVRNLDKARELLPASVELVAGDVSDPASLDAALIGTDNLYVHLNTTTLAQDLPFYEEREGVMNVVAAARRAGVGHLMQIGGLDALHPEFNVAGKQLASNAIRAAGMEAVRSSGIPFTLFYCSFFVDSMPLSITDDVLVVLGDMTRSRLWFTNTSDYADCIAAAIDNPAAHNRSYAIQGREAFDFLTAAQRFAAGHGGISVEALPIEVVHQLGLPETDAAFMQHVLEVVEQLEEQFVAADTWEELAAPRHSIEEYAASLALTP